MKHLSPGFGVNDPVHQLLAEAPITFSQPVDLLDLVLYNDRAFYLAVPFDDIEQLSL